MKITEVISELVTILKEHGDLEVHTFAYNPGVREVTEVLPDSSKGPIRVVVE